MLRPTLYEVVHDLAHFFQAFPSWGSFQKLVTRVPDNHHEQFAFARLYDVARYILYAVLPFLPLLSHPLQLHFRLQETLLHLGLADLTPIY
jgi:hypothetical protein